MAWKKCMAVFLASFILLGFSLPMKSAKHISRLPQTFSVEETVNNGLLTPEGNLLPGGIKLFSSVVPSEHNQFDVTFSLNSEDIVAEETGESATVLLLEATEKARDSGAFAEYKQSAIDYVNRLLVENSNSKIALITYHKEVEVVSSFVGVEAKDALIASIENISVGNGNFLEKAIQKASSSLQGLTSENKQIVLFGNGEATYSTGVVAVSSSPKCQAGCNGTRAPFWMFDVTYRTEQTVLGNGTTITAGLLGNKKTIYHNLCNNGYTHVWEKGSMYPSNHGDTAIYESDTAIATGINIAVFALGTELTSQGGQILNRIQSNGIAYGANINYDLLMEELAPQIEKKAFTEGEITLPIGEHITIKASSVWCSEGTEVLYKQAERQFTWKLDSNGSQKFTFTIQLEVEQAGFLKNTPYPLYQLGEFTYLDSENNSQRTVTPNSIIQGTYAKAYAVGVWVNEAEEYVTEAGVVTTNPELAKQVSPKIEYYNGNGANQWNSPQSIAVSSGDIQPMEGFILHPTQLVPNIAITDINQDVVSYLPFIETNLSYQIHYYYAGEAVPFDTTTITGVPYGTTITTLPDSPNVGAGYLRSRVDISAPIITNHATTFVVEYDIDNGQYLPYQVEYYLDNVFSSSISDTVLRATPNVVIIPDSLAYAGYSLDEILFGAQTGQSTLTATITETEFVIKVYYKKDIQQQLSYSIEVWLDSDLADTQVKSVWSGEPTVRIEPIGNEYLGYRLKKIVFDGNNHPNYVNATITSTASMVQIYYQKDEGVTLPYTINYYQDNQFTEQTVHTVWVGDPWVTVTPQLDKYAGYSLNRVAFTNQEDNVTLAGEITSANKEFHVFYETIETSIEYEIVYYNQRGEELYRGSKIADHPLGITVIIPENPYQGLRVQKMIYQNTQEVGEGPFVITVTQPNTVVEIHYAPNSGNIISYQIDYYYNGILDRDFRELVSVGEAFSQITQITEKPKTGFSLSHITPSLPYWPNNNDTIETHYTSNGLAYFEYKIKYYKDGVLVPGASETAQVSILNPQVNLLPNPEKYIGYQLEKVVFEGREGASSVTGEIDFTRNEFHVYYTSTEPEKETTHYTVEYYYDNLLDDGQTERNGLLGTSPLLLDIVDKPLVGYRRADIFTVPSLPTSIREGDVIRAYYVTEENEVLPEEPSPETDDIIRLATTLNFYKNGNFIGQNGTYILDLPIEEPIVVGDYLGNQIYNQTEYEIEQIIIEESTTGNTYIIKNDIVVLGESVAIALGDSGTNAEDFPSNFTQKDSISSMLRGLNVYRLNSKDIFLFAGENQYDIEVLYRNKDYDSGGVVIPPKVQEPKGFAGSSGGKVVKAQATDTSPNRVTASKAVVNKEEQSAFIGESEKSTNQPNIPLPRTGGIKALVYPTVISFIFSGVIAILS